MKWLICLLFFFKGCASIIPFGLPETPNVDGKLPGSLTVMKGDSVHCDATGWEKYNIVWIIDDHNQSKDIQTTFQPRNDMYIIKFFAHKDGMRKESFEWKITIVKKSR